MSTAAIQTEARRYRKPGRPSTAAPFAGLVREMLSRDPSAAGATLLEVARQQGYDGGHSAFYALVATVRAQAGMPSYLESRASAAEAQRAAEADRKANREAAKAQKKADREARNARWAAEAEERRQRKARALDEYLAVATRAREEREREAALRSIPATSPKAIAVAEAIALPVASGGPLDPMDALRAQIAELTKVVLALTGVPSQKQTTIAQLFDAYRMVRQADTSWQCNRNRLVPLVRRLGGLRVAELTPTVWAEHLAARKTQETMRNAPPTDHTLNIELGRAKQMIDWGVEAGLVDANALKAARPVRTISARETFLTEPQVQELLGGVAAIPAPHGRIITRGLILCAYDGMMRFNEVRHLRRDRFGKDGVVELQAKMTKSRKRRMVALTPRALEALAAIPPVEETQFFFAAPETGRLHGKTTMFSWFRAACIASGVDKYAADGEKVLIHTLRHSGASAADARGASPMAIKEALGHSSIATTEKYLHRHREASARDLARLMAEGAAREAGGV
ncbi:MAG: site-specific integrase [Pseudomonadota bacterium]